MKMDYNEIEIVTTDSGSNILLDGRLLKNVVEARVVYIPMSKPLVTIQLHCEMASIVGFLSGSKPKEKYIEYEDRE